MGVRMWSPWNKDIKTTHDAGKSGMNLVTLRPSLVKHFWVAGFGSPSPTPLSPEENITEMPRAPIILCFRKSLRIMLEV